MKSWARRLNLSAEIATMVIFPPYILVYAFNRWTKSVRVNP